MNIMNAPLASDQNKDPASYLLHLAMGLLGEAARIDMDRDDRLMDVELAQKATDTALHAARRADSLTSYSADIKLVFYKAQASALQSVKLLGELERYPEMRKETDILRSLSQILAQIVEQEALGFEDRDPMSEAIDELCQATVRFAVYISNPDNWEFAYVGGDDLRVGHAVHTIAASLSFAKDGLDDQLRGERRRRYEAGLVSA